MLNTQDIPLSKLVSSSANVRRAGRSEGLKELAASIKAHGLLQNLTVRKGQGDHKGSFEVIAGGRRLAALQRLVKEKHLAATTKIPCHVLEDESAEEVSLAENLTQCPMHPADQYEAFAKLHAEQNMPAEDIAARFGISASVVKQRLKLGGVSPKLIKRYRDGEMTLDQLTAFTITDDHKAQERVWKELPEFRRSRGAILAALTEAHVPSDDRRAVFVGLEAYKEAGGSIVRDLFDAEGGGYLTDPELLNRLARDKLQRLGRKVMGEGWKWVSVDPDFDHEGAARMRRVRPSLSPEDEARCRALESERDALFGSETDLDEDAFADKDAALENEIEAIGARASFRPDDLARSGAFVCLDHDGTPRVERGYVRPEDAEPERPNPRADEDEDTPGDAAQPKPMPDKLLGELTAARTSAMRNELGQSPEVALVALAHALTLGLFYHSRDESCLDIAARSASLRRQAPGIEDSLSERELGERHAAWKKYLPEDSAALWLFIEGLQPTERMGLLAHCAALSVDATQDAHTPESLSTHAAQLAAALKLDMVRYWKPTAANYLGRVSKDRVLEALREGVSPECADNLAGLKKQAMAEAAQQRLDGKGWLPPVLRAA